MFSLVKRKETDMELKEADGIGCLLLAGGCAIGAVVTLVMGCVTGNWSPFGSDVALMFVSLFIGGALTSNSPPVRYCHRCGTRHALPKGPNCPR